MIAFGVAYVESAQNIPTAKYAFGIFCFRTDTRMCFRAVGIFNDLPSGLFWGTGEGIT